MIDDPRELHRRATTEFGDRVHMVADDQWSLPTPCEDWTVRDLVGHLVHENRWAVPLLEGLTMAEVGDELDRAPLGADPRAAWDASAREARGAVDAVDLRTTVHLSYGDVTASHYLFEYGNDLLVHSWDLARALGVDEALDAGAVEASYAVVSHRTDALAASGLFAEPVEVGADADTQARLLAVTGRRA